MRPSSYAGADAEAEVTVPESGMVLAAGLGTRMRPLTDTRPKPLIEVGGKTLLDWALDHYVAAGLKRIVVNVHYFADQIEAHLTARAKDGLETLISDERGCLLETGGGVTKALPLLTGDSFYVVNSDNLWVDGPVDTLKHMAGLWVPETMDALLLMVPLKDAHGYDGRGDFNMDSEGRLSRRGDAPEATYVFGGVQILSRRLFGSASAEPFSLNRLFDKALAAGRLYGTVHQGQWYHVGTPEAVEYTTEHLTRG